VDSLAAPAQSPSLSDPFPSVEGARFDLPADWQLIKVDPLKSSSIATATIFVSLLLITSFDGLFGGLVECNIYPCGIVAGITKRAQPQDLGITYELHFLIPTKQGIISGLAFADERKPTGLREALMRGTQDGSDPETTGRKKHKGLLLAL